MLPPDNSSSTAYKIETAIEESEVQLVSHYNEDAAFGGPSNFKAWITTQTYEQVQKAEANILFKGLRE